MRPAALFALCALFLTQGFARLEQSLCGTYRDGWREELHLHRHAATKRRAPSPIARIAPAAAPGDVGDIAILEDSGGVVAQRNLFNLDQKTLQFLPTDPGAALYTFQIARPSYDTDAASAGSIVPLADDDSAAFDLPFSFPFFGNSYLQIFVNSDGNLTFQSGDSASSQRSLGQIVAGSPRIAPLFMDLDPSQKPDGVRVLSEAGRFVVSWVSVPEYSDFGSGLPQTFQVRLYPDGRVEFAYNGISTDGAVLGISPGGLRGTTSIVSFAANVSGQYSSTIAERFGGIAEVDIVTAAQNFYQTHDDSYDYLVIYNNEGIGSCTGAVACEMTVRNNRSGYGDTRVEIGEEFGSASRLQAVLNMGPLNEYPIDPNAAVPSRGPTGDTPLSLLGHEAGHLFLAYASVPNPASPSVPPMLDSALAHWAFTFDSEGSFMQGNRIRDDGPGFSPRFTTTATVQEYSPLDQYLMGFRAPEEVDPPFLVNGPSRAFALRLPQVGVSFDGQRQDIGVQDIISAEGRRTPDSTVSQRRFRFAFILIAPQGAMPSQSSLDQIDTYRRQFEAYYGQAASGQATADTALRLSLRLSTFPAAGVFAGATIPASLSIQKPAPAPLAIALTTMTGAVSVDPSVTIPAGATSVTFNLTGVAAGVDEIAAQPADAHYDAAVSRIQVLSGPDAAQLSVVSSDAQYVTLRVTDVNNLPYPGVPVQAGDSIVISDSDGRVTVSAGVDVKIGIH
jgi:hypothetical protein